MSNIARRNQGRSMDPWRDFFDVDFFGSNWPKTSQRSFPAVNISEDDKNYVVDVVAPGFKKDDFKIKVDNDVLTISAETKQESNEGNQGNEGGNQQGSNQNQQGGNQASGNKTGTREYSRREYTYSSFTRSFQLPDNAKDDSISASYNDGILQITIPKSKQETKATKEIKIQ